MGLKTDAKILKTHSSELRVSISHILTYFYFIWHFKQTLFFHFQLHIFILGLFFRVTIDSKFKINFIDILLGLGADSHIIAQQ